VFIPSILYGKVVVGERGTNRWRPQCIHLVRGPMWYPEAFL
jgi:hypothetical protein